MPELDDGNDYKPFEELMRLEKINEANYRSTSQPFAPGGQHDLAAKRSYGGHVYAQAAWAACQTVVKGMILHSISGAFLLAGDPTIPFIYRVHNIRDGRTFCQRIVNVTQREGRGICFTCTASFKLPETSPLDVQAHMDLWEKYSAVLKGKIPYDFEECPGMDKPWFWKIMKETGFNNKFPGLQMHKVDMAAYNNSRHPLDRRQLIMYRAIGELPPDPNLHLVAHLYASDRNSLFIVVNQFDLGDNYTNMASLMHVVVFHAPVEDLMFGPSTKVASHLDDKTGRWFCKEAWGSRLTGGRGMYHSNLHNAAGVHIATMVQDGMIRVQKNPEATAQEVEAVKIRERNWKSREKL